MRGKPRIKPRSAGLQNVPLTVDLAPKDKELHAGTGGDLSEQLPPADFGVPVQSWVGGTSRRSLKELLTLDKSRTRVI